MNKGFHIRLWEWLLVAETGSVKCEGVAARKTFGYLGLIAVLLVGYGYCRNSTWLGSNMLHTIAETVATLLAFMVGVIALARFYALKSNKFLLIGAGFIGTALLDGYHAVVTSFWFNGLFPSPSLIPWSWNRSRIRDVLFPLQIFRVEESGGIRLPGFYVGRNEFFVRYRGSIVFICESRK